MRDVCKPRDSWLSHQLRLEQGCRLGRRMDNGKQEGVQVQGKRMPITKSAFQSLCDLHDEGTFMAQWAVAQNGKEVG